MQTAQIDHIGIAVKNIEEAAKLYTDLGLKVEGTEVVESQKVKVDNIEKALEELSAKGYQLIDKTPRIGAGGHKIAFLHPKSTKGVLLELSQSH